MTDPVAVSFIEPDTERLAAAEGRIAVVVPPDGRMDRAARRIDRLTRGALGRLLNSAGWPDTGPGEVRTIDWPVGLAARALDVLCLPPGADAVLARKGGVALGKRLQDNPLLLASGALRRPAELALGVALRAYAFTARKGAAARESAGRPGPVTVMTGRAGATAAAWAPLQALAEGVFLARDLVNEPANHLTTESFGAHIAGMAGLGLRVTVLDTAAMTSLGLGALLGVAQGSDSPPKLAVMEWRGGPDDAAPLALVGKGVVFDTGGISIKGAQGMEEMTMDMAGAAAVVGTMHALARRNAPANVVGLVGLVENMPSGRATRPGDVVTTLQGDTVEVINTDAEGRLVLADLLTYAQRTHAPRAIVDLATLTGAIIVALGHEKAGVFANDDAFCAALLKAADAAGEGVWRMPLDPGFDDKLKSDIADVKNVGGRPGGAGIAARFVQRFVADGTPWVHLDIAGVARVGAETSLAPKGPTGWGVLTLSRLIDDMFAAAGPPRPKD